MMLEMRGLGSDILLWNLISLHDIFKKFRIFFSEVLNENLSLGCTVWTSNDITVEVLVLFFENLNCFTRFVDEHFEVGGVDEVALGIDFLRGLKLFFDFGNARLELLGVGGKGLLALLCFLLESGF